MICANLAIHFLDTIHEDSLFIRVFHSLTLDLTTKPVWIDDSYGRYTLSRVRVIHTFCLLGKDLQIYI